MNAPQPISPRRRLQELLAIPDSQRTEAEWDELNELEISLAPGNRAVNPQEQSSGGGGSGGGRRAGGQNSGGRNAGGHKPGGRGAGAQNAGGQNPGAQNAGGQNGGGQAPKADGAAPAQAKKPARKFHKRPAKPKTPAA